MCPLLPAFWLANMLAASLHKSPSLRPSPYVPRPKAWAFTHHIRNQFAGQLYLRLTDAPSNQRAAIKEHPIVLEWHDGTFHPSRVPDGPFYRPPAPQHRLRDGLEWLMRLRASSTGPSLPNQYSKIFCLILSSSHVSALSLLIPCLAAAQAPGSCLFNATGLAAAVEPRCTRHFSTSVPTERRELNDRIATAKMFS